MTSQEQNEEIPGITELELHASYSFKNRQTLVEALTHASFSNENGLSYCNERLEFLGDAVLELCASSVLFEAFPDDDEGALSHRRASIVCEDSLSAWAVNAGIPSLLRLGRGLSRSGGRRQPVLCANAAEAVFGAIFIDGGYQAARTVVGAYCQQTFAANGSAPMNPKATLQELMEKMGLGKPEYTLTGRSGPPHAPLFQVSVGYSGRITGGGEGRTIKEAERKAAEKGLQYFLDDI
ncbi:MAG: ribonuclease III [Thermovirgaceae bacterium]|nr:ribonuclease III [Thermovirgaceae bacterium]